MRLIKAQSTSVRNIKAKGIRYDINQVVQLGGEQAVVQKPKPMNPMQTVLGQD